MHGNARLWSRGNPVPDDAWNVVETIGNEEARPLV
jgi:hypothetical protein